LFHKLFPSFISSVEITENRNVVGSSQLSFVKSQWKNCVSVTFLSVASSHKKGELLSDSIGQPAHLPTAAKPLFLTRLKREAISLVQAFHFRSLNRAILFILRIPDLKK
jgi:hypothetical protein